MIRHITIPSPGGRGCRGGGTQKVFILATPTLTPPCLRRGGFAQAGIEGGGDYWGDLKYSLLIFNVHTIMN